MQKLPKSDRHRPGRGADVGLLKSRKDAGKEFEQYVDAVEHPPELDDYVEEEAVVDDSSAGQSVSVEEIEAQLAARRPCSSPEASATCRRPSDSGAASPPSPRPASDWARSSSNASF